VVALNGAPAQSSSSSPAAFVLESPKSPGNFAAEHARLADEIAAANQRAAVAKARTNALPPRAAIANLTLQLRTSVEAAVAAEAQAEGGAPTMTALPPITLIIDAEAFGRAIGTVLGEQLSVRGVDNSTVGSATTPVKLPLKHARHVDVFLIGVATLIVLVILAAWIG
jgi:hypothetical protein